MPDGRCYFDQPFGVFPADELAAFVTSRQGCRFESESHLPYFGEEIGLQALQYRHSSSTGTAPYKIRIPFLGDDAINTPSCDEGLKAPQSRFMHCVNGDLNVMAESAVPRTLGAGLLANNADSPLAIEEASGPGILSGCIHTVKYSTRMGRGWS